MGDARGPGTLADLARRSSRPTGLGAMLGRLVDRPRIGPWMARALRAPNQIPYLTVAVTRLHAWLLRRTGGRLRRSWLFAAGQPVLSLTTTGRRSGRQRSTAVACFVHGDDLALAGMNLGRAGAPAWALNLDASSRARIELGGRVVDVMARRAEGAEREALWRRWLELQPSAAAFQELAGREIPLYVLTPA